MRLIEIYIAQLGFLIFLSALSLIMGKINSKRDKFWYSVAKNSFNTLIILIIIGIFLYLFLE